MTIDNVLDVLDELLDKSWSLPLSGGRCVVDADKVRDLIDDIRINLPSEIEQAKMIVADRAEIMGEARREAEGIIRKAEERAKALIANEEIAKAAQSKAADIMSQTQLKSREMRVAASEFSDNILRTTEEALTKSLTDLRATTEDALTKSLTDLRATRQALRNSAKNKK